MLRDPYDNIKPTKSSKDLTKIILRLLGFKDEVILVELVIWLISQVVQILSIGAKVITRKKLGLRAMGRYRAIFYLVPTVILGFEIFSTLDGFNFPENLDKESLFLFIYAFLVSVLSLSNFKSFHSRSGKERNSFFRGYGILVFNVDISEKKLKWIRLTDPILFFLVSYIMIYVLGEEFGFTAFLIRLSCIFLFIEELLYINNEMDFELDTVDVKTIAKEKASDNSTNY